MTASFNKFYGKMWDGICLNIGTPPGKGFILKLIERLYVPLNGGSRDF